MKATINAMNILDIEGRMADLAESLLHASSGYAEGDEDEKRAAELWLEQDEEYKLLQKELQRRTG